MTTPSQRALILYRRRRFINHLLTYLLTQCRTVTHFGYLADWCTLSTLFHSQHCNLFDYPDNWYCFPLLIASRLMSETNASLTQWFIDSYIRKRRCIKTNVNCQQADQQQLNARVNWNVFSFLLKVIMPASSRKGLITSEIGRNCRRRFQRLLTSDRMSCCFTLSQRLFLQFNPLSRRSSVCLYPLTVRSCLLWLRHLVKIRQPLYAYFTALVFLQVSYKVTRYQLKDELLDVLAITSLTCLQSNDAHRRLNARHSSVLRLV